MYINANISQAVGTYCNDISSFTINVLISVQNLYSTFGGITSTHIIRNLETNDAVDFLIY